MSSAPPPVGWQSDPGAVASSRPSWVTREAPEPGFGFSQAEPPPPPPRKRGVLIPMLAGLLGAIIGSGAMLVVSDNDSDSVQAPAPVGRPDRRPPAAGQANAGVADIASAIIPSVVRIDSTGAARGRSSTSTGSGVIFRSDGHIITNDHVVSGSSSINVTLPSGDKLPAKLVGTAAPSDDIAVIKVDRNDLKPATFGSVADVAVGDLAVAVGSPFGLEGSVTAGVVSALHRNFELGEGSRFTDAVQTDASINPGNSGGALVNGRGEVIGINSVAAVSASGGGVGFAIPVDIARRDAEQIIATGKASRPYLGITGENVPARGGAVIQEVTPEGPAGRAGIQAGDVILEIENSRVTSMEELISVLSRLQVDQTVPVKYRRGGTERTAQVKLQARP